MRYQAQSLRAILSCPATARSGLPASDSHPSRARMADRIKARGQNHTHVPQAAAPANKELSRAPGIPRRARANGTCGPGIQVLGFLSVLSRCVCAADPPDDRMSSARTLGILRTLLPQAPGGPMFFAVDVHSPSKSQTVGAPARPAPTAPSTKRCKVVPARTNPCSRAVWAMALTVMDPSPCFATRLRRPAARMQPVGYACGIIGQQAEHLGRQPSCACRPFPYRCHGESPGERRRQSGKPHTDENGLSAGATMVPLRALFGTRHACPLLDFRPDAIEAMSVASHQASLSAIRTANKKPTPAAMASEVIGFSRTVSVQAAPSTSRACALMSLMVASPCALACS